MELKISAGDIVALCNINGRALLRALITDRTAKGQLFSPMHWTRQQSSAGWVNALTASIVDPVSGQPALKTNTVAAQKFDAMWYGFGASLYQMRPAGAYAAVARSLTGWQGEFADVEIPSSWQDLACKHLNLGACTVSEMQDQNCQQIRLAFYEGDQLVGLFYVGPKFWTFMAS